MNKIGNVGKIVVLPGFHITSCVADDFDTIQIYVGDRIYVEGVGELIVTGIGPIFAKGVLDILTKPDCPADVNIGAKIYLCGR